MHFENGTGVNSNAKDTTATSCTSTSSSDSGVIIIDNQTTISNSNSDNNNTGNVRVDKTGGKATTTNAERVINERKNVTSSGSETRNNNRSSSSNNSSSRSGHINIENIISIGKSPGGSAAAADTTDTHAGPTADPYGRPQAACGSGSGSSPTASKNYSPTLSIRSTTISIVSLDENALDSSVVDTDSDAEADAEGVHSNYIVKKLGQQITYPPNSTDIPQLKNGLTVVSQKINPSGGAPDAAIDGALAKNMLNGSLSPAAAFAGASTPQIGSIALTNSTDVTFGDKHFYEGPVTIQQFLIDNGRDKWKPGDEAGQDNPAFRQEQSAKESGCDASGNPPAADQPYKFIFNRKAVIITSVIIILTILVGVFIVIGNNLSKAAISKSKLPGDGDDSRMNIPINSTIDKDNIGGGNILRIVARDAWLAQPPSIELVPLDLPVSTVIVMPTNTEMCSTQAACTFRVRFIQTYNIESLQNDDIIYNFLIGGDGNVYEGRGWNHEGAHLKGHNDNTISLAYIGTFKHQTPTAKQMNVTKLLLEEGEHLGKLAPNYKIYSANKLDPTLTDTSAKALYESFKGWLHWYETVKNSTMG